MDISEWIDLHHDEPIYCSQIKPFNMRYVSLENFPSNDRRSLNRVAAINRFKEEYLINCPFKSINLLRKILQAKINNEINEILQKYHKMFFQPVLENVRGNLKNNTLADELNINVFMHQILDEAKKMFPIEKNMFLEKLKENNYKDGDETKERQTQNNKQMLNSRTRRSKINRNGIKTKAKRKRNSLVISDTTKNIKNKLFEHTSNNDEKWDPSRLTTKTLFVLGSKANKALGFGSARGRLYSKHSDLFRYIGDHEDKEWLHKNQLMPPTGGKAYLLVKEDIVELINSTEYKNTPGVNVDDMGAGFTVPQSMIEKISSSMKNMKRTQKSKDPRIKGQMLTQDESMEESNLPISDLSFIDTSELLSQFNDKDFLDQ